MEATQQQTPAPVTDPQTTVVAVPADGNQPMGPQSSWNPPTGDEDFDSLFSRTGLDGETLADSNAIPADPTTEPAEPAKVEPAPTAQSKFELKTSTGTIYKSADEAVRGIEQKDQLIGQLRSMVAAVTGEDPLVKSGAKPGQTTAPQKPISYLRDPKRYAEDLTKAAEYGQQTGDWTKYANITDQRTAEVVTSMVGPYMGVVQTVGKQQALDEIGRANPEFKNFYGSDSYQKVLEERPKLANYIQQLEGNPTAQEDLREMYQSVWDHAQAKKVPELVKQASTPPQNPTPRMPMQPTSRPSLRVPDRSMTTVPTNKPSLSTPEGRRRIIEEAEAKGLADVQF